MHRLGVGIVSLDEVALLNKIKDKKKLMDEILKANEAFSTTGAKLTPP